MTSLIEGLRQLLVAFAQTDITELMLKTSDAELTLRKISKSKTAPTPTPTCFEIKSPMDGTFRSAPEAGDLPFVETGDHVRAGQTVVGMVEVRKDLYEIEANVSGLIIEILVQDGERVEYNQTLMRIVD